MTRNTGRYFLFAADQKMEHLHDDFHGEGVDPEIGDPRHLFTIAKASPIGAFATHMGLIDRYAREFSSIPYIVKLNGKSPIVSTAANDPLSDSHITIPDVVRLSRQGGIRVVGVGYTIYLGSKYEHLMLKEAARHIRDAHQVGLLAVLWVYPRGAEVKDPTSPRMIIGAAGIAASLGADVVKLNVPISNGKADMMALSEAVRAAGRTDAICAGGASVSEKDFLAGIEHQINEGHTKGCAIGRNIFQKKTGDAIAFARSIECIILKQAPAQQAYDAYYHR